VARLAQIICTTEEEKICSLARTYQQDDNEASYSCLAMHNTFKMGSPHEI